MLVKVKFNGYCDGHEFKRDEVRQLPDNVLKALGKDAYEVVKEQPEELKPEVKEEEKKIDHAPADKQVHKASNK